MKIILLSALLAANLANAGDELTAARSPTYGKSAEAFATDCDLILFGREVSQVSENGTVGYRIVKTSTLVSVNGHVYASATDQPLVSETDPKIEADSSVKEAAAEYLWSTKENRKGGVAVAGETHPLGVPFALTLPENGIVVEVTFTDDGQWMWIAYGGDRVFFPIERPTVLPESERIEQRLDVAFQLMIEDLKPGRLVVKGGGYAFFFPLSSASAVKASLARIPELAEFERIDNYGRATYKPIRDGDFLWTSSIIRDFLR